jgi:hypothetical protein
MSANRLATLLGALILLSLILYLLMALRRRQTTVVKTKRAKASKVQPKYSPEADLKELSSAANNANNANNEQPTFRDSTQPPSARAAAAGGPTQDHSTILTKPTIVSPIAGDEEHSREEEEREVFEL